jgi:manganese-dependent inorganic pyrophosphatase
MQQSAPDIDQVTVKGVVDHHRISNFQTADPLYYRAEPLGSTATILYKLFNEYEVKIPSDIAGIMLSAVISDTLLLKSPTTTPQDVEIAEELAEIAGVSLDEYGLNMLRAGTDISDKSAEEIFNDDAKTFPMGSETVRIGQVNVVDPNDVLARKDELLEVMRTSATENDYDLTLLMITDIIENNSVMIVDGPAYRQVEIAFSKPIQFNTIELEGVVSRKKQVVPPLTKIFQKQQG